MVRSSHQTELEKLTQKNAELENNLIAERMKLKLKGRELDESKNDAELYRNSTVQLAKQKFNLEREKAELEEKLRKMGEEKSELEVGMGKERDELKAELKKLGEKNGDLERKYLLLKVSTGVHVVST